MKKSQAVQYINSNFDYGKLVMRDTSFANISKSRNAWWLNIKLESFKKDWNILLASETELFWLKIPADTFQDLSSRFRIWEAKNVVDIYISCDIHDQYFRDTSSGSFGVDFKEFVFQKIPIPESLKTDSLETSRRKREGMKQKIQSDFFPIHKQELKAGQQILKDNETNVTYKSLFGEYLKGAKKIVIQDPYIRLPHQFKNLLEFCAMLGKTKAVDEVIWLEIVTWNSEEFYAISKGYFDEVVQSVSNLNIELSYRFEEHHDRYIESDNGWKIILGRGLDIFKRSEGRFTLGDVDQSSRKCKPCEITFLKSGN